MRAGARLTTAEHAGTHFDTPSHWFTGGDHADATTDTIAVERYDGAGVRD